MRIFHPLRRVPVALLWGGMSLSAIGDQLYAVALTWIAVGVLGSNAGYLTALQALITLLAVLFIGVWADRWEALRGMIAADLASAAVLLGVVAAALASGGPGVIGLVCTIVVLAIGQAVFRPALQTVLPSVVADPRLLPAANGLLDATGRTARLFGPGLVALLVSVVPVVHFLTLDAVTFLASAMALALIRRGRRDAETQVHPGKRPPAWSDVLRGYRATAGHPLLGYYLAVSGLLNGVWYAVFFLCLPLMIAQTGIGSTGMGGLGAYGLVLSAYGCGNLAATLILGGRALPARPQFRMLFGNIQTGCGIVLLAAASFLPTQWRLPGLAAAAAFGAMGGPMQDIATAVLRQTRLAAVDRAAAMRAYMAMVCLGILVAMLLTPEAIAQVGVTAVMLGCGAVYLGVATLGLARFAGWRDPAAEQSA